MIRDHQYIFTYAGQYPGGLLSSREPESWRKPPRVGEETAMNDAKSQNMDHGNPWVINTSSGTGDIKVFNTYRGDMPAAGGIIKKRPPGDAGRINKGHSGFAVEDPNLRTISESAEESMSAVPRGREKRDSETNTDLSALMMQRAQHTRGTGVPAFAMRYVSFHFGGCNCYSCGRDRKNT